MLLNISGFRENLGKEGLTVLTDVTFSLGSVPSPSTNNDVLPQTQCSSDVVYEQ
jgi:hypothetical protein